MIKAVRYWDSSAPLADTQKKQQAQAYTRSFQADLLASMAGSGLPKAMNGLDGLDGSAVPGLMQVDVDGIEKVWAEQLKNGASYLSFNQSDEKKSSQLNGLGGMLDLSVQVHMLRAKKNLQRQTQDISLNDLAGKTDTGLQQSLAAMRQQLQNLAKQYDLTLPQLGQQLDLQG